MIIRRITSNQEELLECCRTLAAEDYLDNLVLLGDLYDPCLQLTRHFGMFGENGLLENFFVIFEGFTIPSVVFPVKITTEQLLLMKDFLLEVLPEEFVILSLKVHQEDLVSHFKVNYYSEENCMVLKKSERLLPVNTQVKRAVIEDSARISNFYQMIGASPWNPLLLESGFYRYVEREGEIVAIGGIHFETPKLAQLGNIYVLERYRRKGLGGLVTSAIAQEILKKKELATLFVKQENYPAISLYQKLGFEFYKQARLFFCRKK